MIFGTILPMIAGSIRATGPLCAPPQGEQNILETWTIVELAFSGAAILWIILRAGV